MSEYTETRWRCDFCGRTCQKPLGKHPAGWHQANGFYGAMAHACTEEKCQEALVCLAEDNGFECESLGVGDADG